MKKKLIIKKKTKKINSNLNINILDNSIDNMNNYGSELIEFLNKHNIKHFPINYGIKPNGKKYIRCVKDLNGKFVQEYKIRIKKNGKTTNTPQFKDFKNLTDDEIKARHKYYNKYNTVAIDTNNIKQIDIDSPNYDERIEEIVKTACCYKSLTKTFGRHIFVKCKNSGNNKSCDIIEDELSKVCENIEHCKANNWDNDKDKCKYHGSGKIELLQGKWAWANMNVKLINKGDIYENQEIINWVKKKTINNVNLVIEKKEEQLTGKVNLIINETCTEREIEKWINYADIIEDDIWGEYNKWFQILCSARNIGIPYIKFDNLAKTKPNYKADENKKTWDKVDRDIGKLSKWRTIYEFAEISDIEKKTNLDDLYIVFEVFNKFKWDKIHDTETTKNYNIEKENLKLMELNLIKEDDKTEKKELKIKIKLLKIKLNDFHKIKLKADFKLKQKYFEKFHFKVMNPYGIGRRRYSKVDILDKSSFKDMYENLQLWYVGRDGKVKFGRFIDAWLSDMTCISKEKVDFCPPPLPINKDTFNLFNGLAAEYCRGSKKDCNIDVFLDHIKILAGKSKVVKGMNGAKYILYYLADLVQNPGRIPEIALIFKSIQGTGKSLFFEKFAEKILGEMYLCSTSRLSDFVGKFTVMQNKLLCILDECSIKDTFDKNGDIKHIISQPKINFEAKYKDVIRINNCIRMIINTNNSTPIVIELEDRRMSLFIVDPSKKGNVQYFNKLAGAFNSKDMCYSFYHYLKNIDLSTFDIRNDRTLTKDYYDVQSVNIPTLWRFLAYLCKIPDINEWNHPFIDDLDNDYFDDNEEKEEENNAEKVDEKINGMNREEWENLYFNTEKVYKASKLYKKFVNWLDKYQTVKKKEYTNTTSFGRGLRSLSEEWGQDVIYGKDQSQGKYYYIQPLLIRGDKFRTGTLDKYKEFLYY